MARPFLLISNPSDWPQYFNEPESVYDLDVIYPQIDIEPVPGIPKVGQVVRSLVYATWYHNLQDEIEKEKAKRLIQINKKSEFIEKIQKNSPISVSEHLSVKNAFYLAGNVPLIVAPDVGDVSYTARTNAPGDVLDINFCNGALYIKNQSSSLSYLPIFSLKFANNVYELFILTQTATMAGYPNPSFNFILNNLEHIEFANGQRAFIERVFVLYNGVQNIPVALLVNPVNGKRFVILWDDFGEEIALYVSSFNNIPETNWDSVKQKLIENTEYGLHSIVANNNVFSVSNNTLNVVWSYPLPPNASSTVYNSYEYRFFALSYHNPANSFNTSLEFGEIDNAWSTRYGTTTSWVASSALAATDIVEEVAIYIFNTYIVLRYEIYDGTVTVPYTFVLNTIQDLLTRTTYHPSFSLENVLALNNYDQQINDPIFIFYPFFGYGNYSILEDFKADLSSAIYPVAIHSYLFSINNAYNITLPSAFITFGLSSFLEALERIDNVDILVDGGFTSTNQDFSTYANLIATQANNAVGEKTVAIAAINTPFNTQVSFTYSLPTTTLNNNFLTANYFTYEGLGYRTMLPASSLYALLVCQMSANLNEFAPVYNKSLIPVSPIDKIYNIQQREELAKKRINSLKIYNNAWVFNNNLTTDLNNTIFKEENIKRLANAIARECKVILKTFIGQKNVKETRDRVITKIQNMLRRVIDIHKYRPTEYLIICDETNNTDYSKYLYVDISVRMPISIKYVKLVSVAQLIEP